MKQITLIEDLDFFDSSNFINRYSNHLIFKKDGVKISYLDFGNKNFILDIDFIKQCRKAVNEARESFSLPALQEQDSVLKKYEKIEIVFQNCKFTNFIANEQIIQDSIFIEFNTKDEEVKNLYMNFMRISASKFYGKFYINKQDNGYEEEFNISKLLIENSIFHDNFKLHKCRIDEIHIKDCDFERNSDFFKSKFLSGEKKDIQLTEIYFHALNFRGLALFGNVHFYKKFHLQYVTIEGYSHFRNAIFDEGLDLDYANIQNEMNFFGCNGLEKSNSRKNTSQETYRIIKHQLEKLNNKIDANKYHALEMEQYRKEIKKKILKNFKSFIKFIPDGIISFFHWASSNHSSSWVRALVWILVVSFITNLFLGNSTINFSSVGWNNIFKYINILSEIKEFHYSYIAMTLNKVSLGYLYYQFLTAVRKDTRQ